MIPRRILLQGFLCYREAKAIDFDDSPLWMLSGLNGSGKSAVFDAVTFALFGGHRGGQRNAEELINKESDGLLVELDFCLGDERYRIKRTLNLWIAPNFVIADRHEPPSFEPRGAHLGIWRRQQLEHSVVYTFPVRAVADKTPLISPPDDIATIDHKFSAPSLHLLHDFARDPIAALELENLPVYSRKQFHVFDSCTGHPTLVERQRHNLASLHERHDDLAKLVGGGVEDHFHVAFHHLFSDLIRHNQAKHFNE